MPAEGRTCERSAFVAHPTMGNAAADICACRSPAHIAPRWPPSTPPYVRSHVLYGAQQNPEICTKPKNNLKPQS